MLVFCKQMSVKTKIIIHACEVRRQLSEHDMSLSLHDRCIGKWPCAWLAVALFTGCRLCRRPLRFDDSRHRDIRGGWEGPPSQEARKPQESMPGCPEASRIDARRPGGLPGLPGLALVGPLAGWPAWLAGLAWLAWLEGCRPVAACGGLWDP